MLIGAAIGAAGSIIGGLVSSAANRRVRRRIEGQLAENQNWYNLNYNEDYTQRADAQRLLARTEESIRNRNTAAAARQAVTGGTDESLAAAREANNEAIAETNSRIAAASAARKDEVDRQYRQTKQNLEGQLNGMDAQRAQNTASAIQGVTSAASSLLNIPSSTDIDEETVPL